MINQEFAYAKENLMYSFLALFTKTSILFAVEAPSVSVEPHAKISSFKNTAHRISKSTNTLSITHSWNNKVIYRTRREYISPLWLFEKYLEEFLVKLR